jgi:catechol 2,3-dioxygenase-like lactoylglutathione lyase family enzyme
MSTDWYSRPVLFVADVDRSVDFYVKQLGFSENWRYEEVGRAWVAQVARPGCELILDGNGQCPGKVGNGRMFISLDQDYLHALRAELEGRGVDVKDGHWATASWLSSTLTATSSTSHMKAMRSRAR